MSCFVILLLFFTFSRLRPNDSIGSPTTLLTPENAENSKVTVSADTVKFDCFMSMIFAVISLPVSDQFR